MSLILIPNVAELVRAGWVAARRGDRLVIAVDVDSDPSPRSWLHVKRALLEALTDVEYEAYELMLPVAEQARRVRITWQWRHLSRRCAMLKHLAHHTDDSYAEYERSLPSTEMERRVIALSARRLDMVLPVPVVRQELAALA